MSAPSFVASATASLTTAGTGPLTCNVPTGTSDGDILIAHVAVGSGGGIPSTPSGWKRIRSHTQGSVKGHLFVRLADSEPASYNWSVDASSEYNVITHAYAPSGGSWATADDAIGAMTVANQGGAPHTVPDLRLPSSIDMVQVSFAQLGRGSTTTTQPTSWTMAGNPDSGGTSGVAVESAGAYLVSTPGSGGSTTWTFNDGGGSVVYHLAVVDPGTATIRTIRDYLTGFAGAASSVAITMPYARTGDLLLGIISTTTGPAVDTPSGWSLLPNSSATQDNDRVAAFVRTCDETEGASVTWTIGSGTPGWAGAILVLRDTPALVASAAADTSSNTTGDVPALTMSAASPHAIVVATSAATRADGAISVYPYTALYTVASSSASSGTEHATAYTFTSSANPAATSFTWTGNSTSIGLHIGRATDPAGGYTYGLIIG